MYRHSTCAHNDTTYAYTYWSWKLINLTCSALGQRCSYFWAITFGGRMWLVSLFHRPHRDGHMIWAIMHVSENRAYSQTIPTLPFSYSFYGETMREIHENDGTLWEHHGKHMGKSCVTSGFWEGVGACPTRARTARFGAPSSTSPGKILDLLGWLKQTRITATTIQ